MNVIREIEEVIDFYKQQNKSVDHIVVNRKLLHEATGDIPSDPSINEFELLGYPCKLTTNEYHRFTVQSK